MGDTFILSNRYDGFRLALKTTTLVVSRLGGVVMPCVTHIEKQGGGCEARTTLFARISAAALTKISMIRAALF